MVELRPYQVEIGRAVMDSVLHNRGLTFTVEIARQGGKNELSAQMEVLLLAMFSVKGGNLVKGAPTFDPQVRISMARLKERLSEAGLGGLWSAETGNAFRLGRVRQLFLSAEPSSNVVGATAHILMEIDEAQDVDRDKFYKEFRPMGASTNVTTVLYGTPWKGDTLLEEMKQANLDMERSDGVKRHFRQNWEEVAGHNPCTVRTWRARDGVWGRAILCSARSISWNPSAAETASSRLSSAPGCRGGTAAAAPPNRGEYTWPG